MYMTKKTLSSKTSKKNVSKKNVKKDVSSNDLNKKCEETMCTKFVTDALSQKKNLLSIVIETIHTSKPFLKDPDLEKRKQAKATLKHFLSLKKKMSAPGYFQKVAKEEMRMCKRLYCNPKCVGTSVDERVLKNNFNKDMDPKLLRKLKKEGAISGCILSI